jgi:hypothetical protein
VKHCLFVATIAFATAFTSDAERLTPNSLSKKEIAEGWILLFDGQTPFGWQIDGPHKVANGELVLGGAEATTARATTDFGPFSLQIDNVAGGPLSLWDGKMTVHEGPLKLDWAPGAGEMSRPLVFRVPAGKTARLSGIRLKPALVHSLFSGKDLAGWKKFEANPARAKSEFTVEDGTIHLKNGPGDLQTEEQFDNFVLQIECRTNGPRLNSGVFFRCIPGLYQQGYEAQIHNHFTPAPVREYTIEDYDPKTHELKGKTKVKYTATDYGTGAIYRRIPARGPAAKEGEWFTMTVVANGNHLATWVNGIQQTDWVDNRPLNDNARNGCKVGKGAISLQGHDKTTDLSFRNIRIAELEKGKDKGN